MPERNVFGAVIQARTSSKRLPGKVLRLLGTRPMIHWVVAAALQVVPKEALVVATSTGTDDDSIEDWCRKGNIRCFRGPLENVFQRIQLAASSIEADAIFRICADSPFYRPELMEKAKSLFAKDVDLVTNAFPRSYPKGCTIELINKNTLLRMDSALFTDSEREHVCQHFFAHSDRFRIKNFSWDKNLSSVSLCIDTPEEAQRADRIFQSGVNFQPTQAPLEELCRLVSLLEKGGNSS